MPSEMLARIDRRSFSRKGEMGSAACSKIFRDNVIDSVSANSSEEKDEMLEWSSLFWDEDASKIFNIEPDDTLQENALVRHRCDSLRSGREKCDVSKSKCEKWKAKWLLGKRLSSLKRLESSKSENFSDDTDKDAELEYHEMERNRSPINPFTSLDTISVSSTAKEMHMDSILEDDYGKVAGSSNASRSSFSSSMSLGHMENSQNSDSSAIKIFRHDADKSVTQCGTGNHDFRCFPQVSQLSEACSIALTSLKKLLDSVASSSVERLTLIQSLQYTVDVLQSANIKVQLYRNIDSEDELSEVEPDAVPTEVREWLASTFTRQHSQSLKHEKRKFRSVAHAIRAGIMVDRIYRRISSYSSFSFPLSIEDCIKKVDSWEFDVFDLSSQAAGFSIKYLTYEYLNRYGILEKFRISLNCLDAFLNQIQNGYCKFKNPYHNSIHAADVTQTLHCILYKSELLNWLTDLELFATLFAALIHDYEHNGTTNNFHVMSGSSVALLYNDRSVLENHHVSAVFRLMRQEEFNILSNLSREEYRDFRSVVIDMVLSTDMSFHFQQIKNMKSLLADSDSAIEKQKALNLLLHFADISHPSKPWRLHRKWTEFLLEEFFCQGDKEQELGLPYSPLCDRSNTHVADSQIGFIDFILEPSANVCADMIDRIIELNSLNEPKKSNSSTSLNTKYNSENSFQNLYSSARMSLRSIWRKYILENRQNWKMKALEEVKQTTINQNI